MHCIIRLVQVGLKPSCKRTASIKSHLRRSYALLISVLTAIEQCLVAWEVLRKCRTSWEMRMLSVIALFWTKAD